MNYQMIKERFVSRMLTKIVNVTRQSPLRFMGIMVYSCLVERATHKKGARQKQISRATGLHESTAVPKALLALQRHGLVAKRGLYWWAVEPTADTMPWFKFRKGTEGQNWSRRFAYWWTAIRKSKSDLTATQSSLYFKLVNLSDYGRRITKRGLATLLGVDVKTVGQGVKKLQAANLVDADLFPLDPSPLQVKWFKPRKERPAFRVSDHFDATFASANEEAALSKPLIDQGGKLLTDAGFSEKKTVQYFGSVLRTGKQWPVVYSFLAKFEKFFASIQRQHQSNVAAGKYTRAKDCGGLLRIETEKQIAAMLKSRSYS